MDGDGSRECGGTLALTDSRVILLVAYSFLRLTFIVLDGVEAMLSFPYTPSQQLPKSSGRDAAVLFYVLFRKEWREFEEWIVLCIYFPKCVSSSKNVSVLY